MTLPTCECISDLPSISQKLGAIYGALWVQAGSPDTLPSYDCIGQYSVEQILNYIYCVILANS